MGKISLRAYNHDIETLIERGHTEEAIAHCKYILKTYPKHLDTYRLLGKAFLESQRYSEAADILQRILSVLPDDFVAQIGMSIIREDEGNLDAAIYHMERAFEIQPSNAAIQDELRRLYGRRDGIEPSKLRLTRGALVRMYARGDLYRQAIAEARAALVEDPQRLDLEIVLARMYSHTGQKAEAAEICSRLVSKLPYCLEANRILAEVLPETSRAEDAKNYQQRLVALDPYLGYLSESAQDVNQVPDNAVTLDRLEWVASLESNQQPTWAKSLGIQIVEKETEKVPDWMTEMPAGSDQDNSEEQPAQPFSEEPALFEEATEQPNPIPDGEPAHAADLPDWMQSIGWSISGQPAAANPPEAAPADLYPDEGETPAAPAEIPDWLKDIAPSEQPPALVSSDDQQNLDWLTSALPPESPAAPEAVANNEPNLAAPEPAEPQALAPEPEAQPADSDELPDWLKSSTPGADETLFMDQSQEPLPDWLTESVKLHGEPPVVEEISEPEIAAVPEPKPVVEDTQPIRVVAKPEDAVQPTTPEAIVEPAATPEAEASVPEMGTDDAMAWLESLAAKQGADESTLLTRPEDRMETPPEWISKAFETVQPAAAVEETPLSPAALESEASAAEIPGETPVEEIPTAPAAIESEPSTVEIPGGPAVEEIPVTPAAIESEPSTIEIPGEPTVEGTPLAPAAAEIEPSTAEIPVESAVAPPAVEAVPPVPLEEISAPTPTEAISTEPAEEHVQEIPQTPEEPSSPTEETLPTVGENPTTAATPLPSEALPQAELPSQEVTPAPEATPPESADLDDAFAWLESLAAKHGADADTLLVAPEERQETAPDWIQQQTPLTELTDTAEPAEVAAPDSATGSHIADWIIHTEETPVTDEIAEPEESTLPDWLKQLKSSPDAEFAPSAPEEEPSPVMEQTAEPPSMPQPEKAGIDWFQEFNEPTTEGSPTAALDEEKEEKPAEDLPPLPAEGPLPVTRELGKTRPLPSWLAGGPVQPPAEAPQPQEPPLPEWMQAVQPVEPQPLEPAAAETPAPEAPELPDWLKNMEAEPQEVLPGEPILSLPTEPTPASIEVSANPDEMIGQAQTALGKGQVDLALSIYNQLIPQGQHLDETIHDLRDALYRFPVESSIWQTLGDACMRDNRLQEALDAYTKAEELLK